MPEIMSSGVRLTEDGEKKIPLIAGEKVAADCSSASDTLAKGSLEPGERQRVPVTRVITIERGMPAMSPGELLQQFGRLGHADRSCRPSAPCLYLQAADAAGDSRLRNIKDCTAVLATEREKLRILSEIVSPCVGALIVPGIEFPAAPVAGLPGLAPGQHQCPGL